MCRIFLKTEFWFPAIVAECGTQDEGSSEMDRQLRDGQGPTLFHFVHLCPSTGDIWSKMVDPAACMSKSSQGFWFYSGRRDLPFWGAISVISHTENTY